MSDTVQVFTLQTARDCLACEFSVERLVDALEANTFTLCRVHMLRASVHMTGATPLALVDPPTR